MISVIIPHLNQPESLEACLRSLDLQSIDQAAFEIIVVDNGSDASPAAIVARHAGAILLREPRPGPGPARNAGAQRAKGDILAFIDADCRAHPDWLINIAKALQSFPAKTVLGGDVRIWRDEGKPLTAIAAYESVFAYRFKMYIERQGFAGTGNLAVYRSDFAAVGPFAGIDVAEDMDWGRRACAAGYRFRYVPDMIVFHPARCSLDELYLKWDRQMQHYLNMARGKPGWRAFWIARALLILASPVVDSVKVLSSDRVEGGSARLKAIRVLFAVRFHRTIRMLALLNEHRSVEWNRGSGT